MPNFPCSDMGEVCIWSLIIFNGKANSTRMIAESISSALILESDADWDMRIKDIMTEVAEGAKVLIDWPFDAADKSFNDVNNPYGERWDILWIGHCGSSNHGEGRIYSINDSTVPPEDHEFWFAGPPQDEQHRPGTRILYQFQSAVCSTSYAISYSGAVKLVELFKKGNENLDLELMIRCNQRVDLTCLAVWPQIVTAAGSRSNIEHPENETADLESQVDEAFSVPPGPALQYSARVNADQVISKGLGRASWIAQWNSTWVMINSTWTLVSFDDADLLKKGEKMKNGANRDIMN